MLEGAGIYAGALEGPAHAQAVCGEGKAGASACAMRNSAQCWGKLLCEESSAERSVPYSVFEQQIFIGNH